MATLDFVIRGRQLSAQGRHIDAVKVCRLGLLANPSALEGRRLLAENLLRIGRFDEVLAEVRVILQKIPTDEIALRIKGEALLGRGDSLQAVGIFTGLCKNSDDLELKKLLEHTIAAAANQDLSASADTSISWTRDYPGHVGDGQSGTAHFLRNASSNASSSSSNASFSSNASSDGEAFIEPPTIPAEDATAIEPPKFGTANAVVGRMQASSLHSSPNSSLQSSSKFASKPSANKAGVAKKRKTQLPPPRSQMGAKYSAPQLRSEDGSHSIELSASDLELLALGVEDSIELSSADLFAGDESAATQIAFSSENDGRNMGLEMVSANPLGCDRSDVASVVVGRGAESLAGAEPTFVFSKQDKSRQDKSRQDEPRQDESRQHEPLESSKGIELEIPAEAPLFLERDPEHEKKMGFPSDQSSGLPEFDPPSRAPQPSPSLREIEAAPSTSIESPRSLSRERSNAALLEEQARERRSAPLNLLPELSQLFPDDVDGVSKLAPLDALSEEPYIHPDSSVADSLPKRSENESSLDEDGDRARSARPSQSPASHGPAPRPVRRVPSTVQVSSKRQSPDRGQQRGRRLSLGIVVGLGVLMIGAGLAAGVMMRKWRANNAVDRAVRSARTLAATGNYLDVLRAQSLLVAAERVHPAVAASRRQIAAHLAVDFGVDVGGEDEPLGHSAEDQMVQGFRALARGEPAKARQIADSLIAAHPSLLEGAYLQGLALAELGLLEEARSSFRTVAESSVLARARLADVLRMQGDPAAAAELTRNDNIAAARIAHARALARAGTLPEGEEPEAQLRALVADASQVPSQQRYGVSFSQALVARLALIEVAIARGNVELARTELAALTASDKLKGAGVRLALAESLLRTGAVAKAALEQAFVAKAWPQSPRTQILAARIAVAGGNARLARKILDELGEISEFPDALAIRGQLALDVGRLGDAQVDIDKALATSPKLEDAILTRARLDLALGKPKLALERIEELPSGLFGSARDVVRAKALRALGKPQDARTILTRLGRNGVLELARLEVADGNIKSAIKAYDQALSDNPQNVAAALERSTLLLDSGQTRAAYSDLEALAARKPNRAEVLLATARVRTLFGMGVRALEFTNAAAAIPGTPAELVSVERGRALLSLGRLKEAQIALETAIATAPSQSEPYLLLGELFLRLGNVPASKRNLAAARSALGNSYELVLLTGINSLVRQQPAEAVETFLVAKARKPTHQTIRGKAELLIWLGRAYELKGDLRRARRNLSAALSKESTLVIGHLVLGDVALGERRLSDAIRRYQKVIELAPAAYPRALLQLGGILVEQGKTKRAIGTYLDYLARVPTGDGADEANERLAQLGYRDSR